MASALENIYYVWTNCGDWQFESWKLAKAQKQFEIEGFNAAHHAFAMRLRTAFGYSVKLHQTKIVFTPRVALD